MYLCNISVFVNYFSYDCCSLIEGNGDNFYLFQATNVNHWSKSGI